MKYATSLSNPSFIIYINIHSFYYEMKNVTSRNLKWHYQTDRITNLLIINFFIPPNFIHNHTCCISNVFLTDFTKHTFFKNREYREHR